MKKNFADDINTQGLASIAELLGIGEIRFYTDEMYGPPGSERDYPRRLKVSKDFIPQHQSLSEAFPVCEGEVTWEEYNQCVSLHNRREAEKEGNEIFLPRYLECIDIQ